MKFNYILRKILTNRILVFIILYGLLDYKIRNPIKTFFITILFIFVFEKSKTFCILEPFRINF